MKKNFIYVLTGIAGRDKTATCVGLYLEPGTAIEQINKWPGNIWDNDRLYLVLEKVPEGIEPYSTIELDWFKFNGKSYDKIEKPDWSNGIICWTVA